MEVTNEKQQYRRMKQLGWNKERINQKLDIDYSSKDHGEPPQKNNNE